MFVVVDDQEEAVSVLGAAGRRRPRRQRGLQDDPAGVHQLPHHLHQEDGGSHPHKERVLR